MKYGIMTAVTSHENALYWGLDLTATTTATNALIK